MARLRAERRCGQLLKEMDKAKGAMGNSSNLATKEGLHDVKTELNHKIDMVDQKIDSVAKDLTIKLYSVVAIATGIIVQAIP